MATEVSTSLSAAMLAGNRFDELMRDGAIEIRSGAQPAGADLPATGVLLARITRDGLAWTPGDTPGGLRVQLELNTVQKVPSHSWELIGIGTGTAGWFRWLANAPGTDLRIDGTIGALTDQGDYQLFMNTRSITPTTRIGINDWWFTLPPLGVPV